MEVKGRECEEVKIGKFKYYFLARFKGKESMGLDRILYSESATVNSNGEVSIDASKLINTDDDLLRLFCMQILDEDNKEYEPAMEFLEELDLDEFSQVQALIQKAVNTVRNGEKKISYGSEKKR